MVKVCDVTGCLYRANSYLFAIVFIVLICPSFGAIIRIEVIQYSFYIFL